MITTFFNIHPAIVLAIITVSSVAIFLVVWLLLNVFYSRAFSRLPFINRFIEKTRGKGESPLVRKYGLIGLALFNSDSSSNPWCLRRDHAQLVDGNEVVEFTNSSVVGSYCI
jgi:hypothetical protein